MTDLILLPHVRRMRETQRKQYGQPLNHGNAEAEATDIANALLAFLPFDEQNNPQALYDLTNVLMDIAGLQIDNPEFKLGDVIDGVIQARQEVFELARQDGKL